MHKLSNAGGKMALIDLLNVHQWDTSLINYGLFTQWDTMQIFLRKENIRLCIDILLSKYDGEKNNVYYHIYINIVYLKG